MFKQARSFALSEKHVVFFYILSKMKKSTTQASIYPARGAHASISGYAEGCAITNYLLRTPCERQKI